MPERRVTLADIARRAGVHATTVSLALRNHPRLPENTRARLRRLADEMGYTPDPGLRALAEYRNHLAPRRHIETIAHVFQSETRWSWKEDGARAACFRGAHERANDLGFQIEPFWLGEPGLTPERLGGILEARAIRGVLASLGAGESGPWAQFPWSRFCVVKVGASGGEPHFHSVSSDHLTVTRLAMQKTRAAGYRRIGFALGPESDPAVDCLSHAGFLCEQETMVPPDRIAPFPGARRDRLEAWLERNRPEVVIGMSAWLLPRLAAAGWRVPEDIALVDVNLEDADGRLAGVRQNHAVVGAVAVELLVGQLQRNACDLPVIPTATNVEGTWVEGKSLPLKARGYGARAPEGPSGRKPR